MPASTQTGQLPLAQYASKQGVLACLLMASFFLLPRSKWPYAAPPERPTLDRPEWPFMVPITANPIRSMLYNVTGAIFCVLWWAPTLRTWWSPARLTERDARVRQTLNRCLEATSMTLASSVIIALASFAMGASLETHALATLLFALHISIIIVWPVIYAVGIDFLVDSRASSHYRMIRIFCEFRCDNPLERALLYPAIGTIAGAWLGSIVFPLDWERPWQSFPLPSTLGSIIGHSAGGALCWAHSTLNFLLSDSADNDVERKK